MDLKKKVGPLPLYGWAIAVGAGVFILIYRARAAAPASAAQAPIPSTGTGGVDPKTGLPFSLENIDPQTGLPYYLSPVQTPVVGGDGASIADQTAAWIDLISRLRDVFAPPVVEPKDIAPTPVAEVVAAPTPVAPAAPAGGGSAAPAPAPITHAQAIDYWRAVARAANTAAKQAPASGNQLWKATASYVDAATHLIQLGVTPPAPDGKMRLTTVAGKAV